MIQWMHIEVTLLSAQFHPDHTIFCFEARQENKRYEKLFSPQSAIATPKCLSKSKLHHMNHYKKGSLNEHQHKENHPSY